MKSAISLLAACALAAQGPPPRPLRGGSGDGIWMRNAMLAEQPTFDPCNAHQPPTGEYHYHADPVCLRLQLSDNIVKSGNNYAEAAAPWHHSPILGWAYDGNPIYGPYGFSNPKDPASAVIRIRSSFALRNMTERHALADWSASLHHVSHDLPARLYGPNIDRAHPLGWYVEDFDFIAGSGDLDLFNGRFAVTPEFPNGTYAYFVTIDAQGQPAFPYVLGRQYYGTVPPRQMRVTAGKIETLHAGDSNDPSLISWLTKYNSESAHVIDGGNAEAGPVATWPGQAKAARADISEVLYSDDWMYVSGSGLASHVMGPWFDPDGSVFRNWPRDQDFQDRFPRHPQAAEVKNVNMLGPLGRWVNGVALFNMLDGASWSSTVGGDVMSPPPAGPGRMPPPEGRRP